MSERDVIFQNIVQDMSEGVITVGFNGIITTVNPKVEQILERSSSELVGTQYAQAFFEYEENDEFNQTILDAVYSKKTMQRIVSYYTGSSLKQLQVTTSYLKDGETPIGIVAVLSDLTEIVELRDSIKAMKRIESLNERLELRNKLLSETFGRFLSDDIVKQLLDTPGGLDMGGRRLDVSIMMSDLRGFTSMSTVMEPEKLIDLLNHYLERMIEIIQKHGGTIIEFLGDGIFALFGAPTAIDNHARECVAAAIEMEAEMDDINEWNREKGYPALQMGIGINTGNVIVGNIGSVKRTKYGAMGLQVNTAGRIESYTVAGEILISEHTYNRIDCELETSGSMEIHPKGIDEPLKVYYVTGIGGKYNTYLRKRCNEPQPLHSPYDIVYHIVDDKHTGAQPEKGRFVAISEEKAVLEVLNPLHIFDNIMIDLGDKLFAKVTGISEYKKVTSFDAQGGGQKVYITFTSKPPTFDTWYGELSGR